MRRVGGVPNPDNAVRLLEQDELVMAFPEGVKGTGKPSRSATGLQRFGAAGSWRSPWTRSPIVPVAVVGSEEIYPKLGESESLARLVGAPFVPITPTFPLFGPLGLVPLPSRWRIEFCDPIDLSQHPRGGRGPPARLRPLRAGPRRDPAQAARTSSCGARRSCDGRVARDTLDWRRMATATRSGGAARFRSAEEMREILDRALSAANADEEAGPLLRATGMRLRLICPDLDLTVNVAASDDPDSCIEWSFSDVPSGSRSSSWTMSSSVANASKGRRAPVAIARGEIRCSGAARAALHYLPAARLITGPYRELVATEFQHLDVNR